jgi:hypothetical protein
VEAVRKPLLVRKTDNLLVGAPLLVKKGGELLVKFPNLSEEHENATGKSELNC